MANQDSLYLKDLDLKPSKRRSKTLKDELGRVCTLCKEYKTWNLFYNSKSRKIKFSQCKQCIDKDRKKNVKRNREVGNKSNKRVRERLKLIDPVLLRARTLRGSLLARVKTKELKATTPTITELYTWLNVEPRICYYSGELLSPITINKGNNKVTIDHKQPLNRGGTNHLNNLCLASHNMNTAKGNMTECEFKALLKLISTWEDSGATILRRLKQGHF